MKTKDENIMTDRQIEDFSQAEESAISAPFSNSMLERLAGNSQLENKPVDPLDVANDASEDGGPATGARATENGRLRKAIGLRFIAARELCGLGQTEAALSLGYANSTQLSLVERGARMPPVAVIIRAATVYGVSVDFLVGLSNEPERDAFAASRNGAFRRMQHLLEVNARAVADVLLETARGDTATELRSIRFVSEIEALLNGIDAFQASNSDIFDELRSGALLVRRARDARQALEKVVTVMGNLDRRAAYAVERARESMVAMPPRELEFRRAQEILGSMSRPEVRRK